jgi:glycosyltransferase involved in cell wall biosynthesis
MNQDMLSKIKQRYAAYQYVLVGADFHSEGGAWRSIHSFYKHLESTGISVLLVDLRRKDGWRQWICALLFSPCIIVNGMAAMSLRRVLWGLRLRRNAAVYLHDTEYMLDALQRDKPRAYHNLAWTLRDRPVLCVSEKMADLYRVRFGARQVSVVYEVTEVDSEPVLEAGKVHIVMVGSLNRRKGYPLFVETAELAAARGLSWRFHWVGGLGEADLAPVSDAISWWGWRDSATPIVKQADVFFLTSIDDPQPLACLEALALGKRAVVYAGTGSAEIIEGLQGCRVFAEHAAEIALEALMAAITVEVDCELVRARVLEIADVRAFARRLENTIGIRKKP